MVPTYFDTVSVGTLKTLGWFMGGTKGVTVFAFVICGVCFRSHVITQSESLLDNIICPFCEWDRRRDATHKKDS